MQSKRPNPEVPAPLAAAMRGKAPVAVLLASVFLFSGCATLPDIPDDAVRVQQPGLDGLELAAWIEQRDGYTYLRAIATNDSPSDYETKEDCGYLWQSELTDENGTAFVYKQPSDEKCDWAYYYLFAGEHKEFLHTWDGRFWIGDTPSDAEAWDAPPGNYTWTLRFLLRGGSDHDTFEPVPGKFLEAQVAFQV